jgi:hypothetical protein
MVAGSVAAHAVGSLLASPAAIQGVAEAYHGIESVGRTAQGALTFTPMLVGTLLALMLIGLAGRASATRRRHTSGSVTLSWFVLLPPLAYAIQEIVERLIHAESFPFNPMHEPAFLLALALQLPFGVLAFAIARFLLKVAEVVGRVLLAGPASPVAQGQVPAIRPRAVAHRRSIALREGFSSRSPPLLVP